MKKILMLSTGGTLASSHSDSGLAPGLHGNDILSRIALHMAASGCPGVYVAFNRKVMFGTRAEPFLYRCILIEIISGYFS